MTTLVAIGSIASAVGGLLWFAKYYAWKKEVAPEVKREEIQASTEAEKKKLQETGRP